MVSSKGQWENIPSLPAISLIPRRLHDLLDRPRSKEHGKGEKLCQGPTHNPDR